ncbi:hypothetical protein [Methylobacterium sp. yr668]|uniref:hypothetical protein n=1 Tax=Methylobacterium sp. yr668 TaxID=1761801 RepID=UPI0008F224C4|nr:hypothetical protein [Methylobacterium sp. yr668]SFS87015.1 hypothetical protein SAMN04487845_108261 [Methylobacterium sp. yr668]
MQFRDGWERETLDGIEVIKHPALRLRVSVMNATSDTGLTYGSPRNRTPKGAAAGRVVDLNGQMELLPDHDRGKPAMAHDGFSIWYLCVHDDGGEVRAELSRPTEFDSDHFVAFNERIFILGQGEWDDVQWTGPDQDDGEEFEVDVRRKG